MRHAKVINAPFHRAELPDPIVKTPRILTTYLRTYYGRGTGDSNEYGLFSSGLFNSLGYDEHFVPLEQVPSSLDELRSHGPFAAAFTMPFQGVDSWIKQVVGPHAPVIVWIPDDAWRFDFTRSLITSGAFDHFITTCEQALPKYASLGFGSRVTLSAFGTRPDFWPKLVTQPETPLMQAAFAGLCYGDRASRLQAIASAGGVPIDVRDTQREVLPLETYHQLMADSAFTLALTSSSHGIKQQKARLFEPQLHGSVLVTEPTERLRAYWTPDEDCIVFTSPQEAQEKMQYLLNHPEVYQEVVGKALTKALSKNTFQHRFAEVFDSLGLPYVLPDFESVAEAGEEEI